MTKNARKRLTARRRHEQKKRRRDRLQLMAYALLTRRSKEAARAADLMTITPSRFAHIRRQNVIR